MTWPQHRQTKYRAQPTVYNGVRYASKKEAEFAKGLDLQKLAQGNDRVDSWESQIRIPLMVNDMKICDYVADFLVRYVDGRVELIETKGYWTPEAKLKKKLFEATWLLDHPNIKYTVQ